MFIKLKKQNGYHAKIMAVLGTFLRWAKDRKYYSGDFYEKTKGKEPEKEVIFLPLNELLHLYSYEFENEKYTKIRDVYCFSCFTGLRFSDIESLKKEHIKSDHLLKFQQKTNDFKKVQLTPFAIEILEKYKDQAKLLPVISSQNTNKYLKECLGVIASKQKENEGFNQSVILRKEIGSKKTEEIVPKHKAITFHTGRKTFISNSIMLGMNIETLKEMGAPRKEEHLKKYKKITEKFQKEQLDNTWGKITINK
jgi:integrase